MVDNFDEFYEDFYKAQFDWYDEKAGRNKYYYRGIKISEIVLASLLPVLVTAFSLTGSSILKFSLVGVSVLLVIFEALESHLNYQKKWMNYRTTAEGLRREEQMFKTGTGCYTDVDNPQELFVERVMSLCSKENRYWEIVTKKAQEA